MPISSHSPPIKGVDWFGPLRAAVLIFLGIAAGLAGTHLIATLGWQRVVAVVLAIPGTVLLFRRPILGVALWLGLAQFVMLAPTASQRKLYWILHRAMPPATAALIGLGSLNRISKIRLARLGWPELAMAGYLFTSLMSVILLHADPFSTAYLLYDRVFSPMCLYLAIRLWHPDDEDFKRLLPVICFLAFSQSLIGALSLVAPQYVPQAWLNHFGERVTGSLVSPSIYGVALLFSGGVLFHAAQSTLPTTRCMLYTCGALASFFFVFLSLSRANWLAGMLVFGGLTVMYSRQMYSWSLRALPLILILGVLFSEQVTTLVNQRLYSEESRKSAASRIPVYVAGFRMLLAKPVYGWGYGNFDRYDRRFQGSVAGFTDDNQDHASHNFYLTLLAEQGLVGFTLYLFPMVWWLMRSLKRRSTLPPDGLWSRKLLGVFWLSILAHIVVNQFSNMREGYGLGLWWLTLGLIASLVDPPRERPEESW